MPHNSSFFVHVKSIDHWKLSSLDSFLQTLFLAKSSMLSQKHNHDIHVQQYYKMLLLYYIYTLQTKIIIYINNWQVFCNINMFLISFCCFIVLHILLNIEITLKS